MSETIDMSKIGLDLYHAERLAKDHGYDSCRMTVVSPRGVLSGQWLDAYLGLFKPDNSDGFVMTKQLVEADFRCILLATADGARIYPAPASPEAKP